MEKTSISGHTRLVGFLASPAEHSISPKMHNFAFQELGIDAVYLAFDIPAEAFSQAIQSIRTFRMLGANVSMPNKILAIDYMDELSEAAALIGAINTIVYQNNRLIGHNTDGIGFCDSLRAANVQITGATMTLIGAGGAATAMICQAALDGMETIHIFSRPGPRYNRMAQKIQEIMSQTACVITLSELDEQEKLAQAIANSDLLANATSVGMKAKESPIDAVYLHENLTVYDAIYEPRETLLLQQAKHKGAQTINGLGMLLYQGAAAFELWTGQQMPVDKVKSIIEKS
ncbi:shikimate dehydrogenase [Enterococcus saccharolyticus]|uniref:Shikimate dehydrogenase (NADP(+)) n=1 Tax=Candidatus Enterococcus willemsii TaxID=1857215 RepID=A0ABQ6YW02_9ENTE|nr:MULTISPECIES: shikimate dehydrogenase [Enterococcus]KAF1301514.1 shikimate dehydrogenase [Enterococcus sp. CU12B]MCD5003167.1 shikimate dehydrogenase [Enterococcus saccharolyticus]